MLFYHRFLMSTTLLSMLFKDLKPDNVGFKADGTCTLMDFGLANCIHSNKNSEDMYQMSGFTGSLRYMAPEVALKMPYNEKADVYSYGILLWQMASDMVPYPDLSMDQFMEKVARGGLRPEIDPQWPPRFQKIISSCYPQDPKKRASFSWIISELKALLNVDDKMARRMSAMSVNKTEQGDKCIVC